MDNPVEVERKLPERGVCETCLWWTGKIVGRVKYDGQCRAYPPNNGSPRWPITDAYEWCGQHRVRTHLENTDDHG